MKILFFGDYSNLHACLAGELRRRGHDVTVISDGGRYMDTAHDILLDRNPGRLGSVRYLYRLFSLIGSLRGYDVVQLINPHFLSLKPNRIRYFFDILRRDNGSVFLTLAGNEYNFVEKCMHTDMFRFSEFRVGDDSTEFESATHRGAMWADSALRPFSDYVYSRIDGAMSVLPEYDMAARPILGDRLKFTNIPVDLSMLPFRPLEVDGKVRFFIGIRKGMEVQKGTLRLWEMVEEIRKEYPGKCEVTHVSNLPLREYLERMGESHIVLDQLYSYSPGTNGFQAMALGRVAATGAQLEYYSYIGETRRPLIALSPLDMEGTRSLLRSLVLDPSPLAGMGREGREIVERDNDVRVVAGKFESHWKAILESR